MTMLLKKKGLLSSVVVLSSVLVGQPSSAIQLNQATPPNYVWGRKYEFKSSKGRDWAGNVTLVHYPWSNLPRRLETQGEVSQVRIGGTSDVKKGLKKYPRWTYERGRNLNATLNVEKHIVCTPTIPEYCGKDDDKHKGGVGAWVKFRYIPGVGETRKIRWIQGFTNGVKQLVWHKQWEQGIDDQINKEKGVHWPFYDPEGAAGVYEEGPLQGEGYFEDAPYIKDPTYQYFFFAETYIVEEILQPSKALGRVVIHNGFRWGFENESGPKFKMVFADPSLDPSVSPDPPVSPPEPLIADNPTGMCYASDEGNGITHYAPCLSNAMLPSTRLASLSSSEQQPARVPENVGVGALLAVGAWGGLSWRKRKQQIPNESI